MEGIFTTFKMVAINTFKFHFDLKLISSIFKSFLSQFGCRSIQVLLCPASSSLLLLVPNCGVRWLLHVTCTCTWPYHLDLACCILWVSNATFSDFLMNFFLILSFSETPSIYRSIAISVLYSSPSSLLVSIHCPGLYSIYNIITGLIIVLYPFLLRLFGIFGHQTVHLL